MKLGLLRWRLMRNPLLLILLLAASAIFSLFAFYRSESCADCAAKGRQHGVAQQQHVRSLPSLGNGGGGSNFGEIDCVINEETTVQCRRDGSNTIYMPFTFIKSYFEVYGKLNTLDGYERFEFSHSYAKVYQPTAAYRPDGVFMSFEHYNVEVRERVKCISAIEGVPVSTQWDPQGHFYPIQIAQFGLSHYSKFKTRPAPKSRVIEDGATVAAQWTVSGDDDVIRARDAELATDVLQFRTADRDDVGVTLALDERSIFFLSLDLLLKSNGSLSVTFQTRSQPPSTHHLHYICSNTLLSVRGSHITYGLGADAARSWTRLSRDLTVDFQKGLAVRFRSKAKRKQLIGRLLRLRLRGNGAVDNLTLSDTAHLPQFYDAANWLVLHQEAETGGWPIGVTRRLAGGRLVLEPGWTSAMAQGQAMSLLVRAYIRTRDKRYLDAAVRATHLFDIAAHDGGVLARFADKYPWYEEYPTTPSSFVLNGFVYSLIGLYDVYVTSSGAQAESARRLYRAGLASLRAMLPLFDTGSGSVYDLRHFTLGVAPNGARWDYHATHVNQLLLIAQIEPTDSFWSETAHRWLSYMRGKRAPHN